MNKKLIFGLFLFAMGMILQEVSYAIDLWFLRVIGGVFWPIGLLMFTKASLSTKKRRKSDDESQLSVDGDQK